MMAWPDQRRTHEALAYLDLLVTTDVGYSPTARVADYVAATKMTFETPSMTQVTEVIKYHTSRTASPSRTRSTRRRCSTRRSTPT